MKATQIAKTDLKPGHRTSLGTVTSIKISPSGKTMVITVRNERDGHEFTDRVSTVGDIFIFS